MAAPSAAEMEAARADIERLAGMIADARRAVVFTGAGISTESGIPDFRSPTGIWSQTTPIYYQDFLASEEARIEAWRRKLLVDRDMVGATPNRGHRAVAKLVRLGKVSSVITQNIDNLHQESGVAAQRIDRVDQLLAVPYREPSRRPLLVVVDAHGCLPDWLASMSRPGSISTFLRSRATG